MISTELTSNENNIYWLTNNDMMNLPQIASVGVLCVYDNSKNINQNQWSKCIIFDMGYHSMTNKHLFDEADYFILLRFLDNSHWELFYDRNDNREIFLSKCTAKNRPNHQIMKYCDPRTKYILTGSEKYVGNEMYESFMVHQKNQIILILLQHLQNGVRHHWRIEKVTIILIKLNG